MGHRRHHPQPVDPLPGYISPFCVSVVLTLVATRAIEGPVTVGQAPSCTRALQVIPAKRGVRGSAILAGVRVFLGEEGRVGPQLIPLEGQERLARLGDGQTGEECGETSGGESREATVLERGGEGVRKEKKQNKERLASWGSSLDTVL